MKKKTFESIKAKLPWCTLVLESRKNLDTYIDVIEKDFCDNIDNGEEFKKLVFYENNVGFMLDLIRVLIEIVDEKEN